MIPRHLVIGTAVMLAIALGMSVYMWRMRGRVPHVEPATYSGPIAPPVSGPTEQVTLYVADDELGMLRAQAARIPLPAGRQERAQELLRALLGLYLDKLSPHPLGASAEVRDVYLVDPGLAVIIPKPPFPGDDRPGILGENPQARRLVATLPPNNTRITSGESLGDGKHP